MIYAPAARMGGARAHVLGLIPELASLAPNDRALLLAQPDLLAELPPLPDTWVLRPERAHRRGFFGRLLWEQRVLPRVANDWRADVLLSFGAFVPLRAPCPTVVEAGNALPFTRLFWQILDDEPLSARLEERCRWALLRASLSVARRILVPTRAMRQDVVARLPRLHSKIDVALWGVANIFHQTRWTQPSGEIVLAVSKHGINKEFDVVVSALPRVAEQAPGVRLVMTGTPDESRWSRASQALAQRLGVLDRICFAGDIPNRRIPALIQQARLVVFPTWCESFGLPLAEALAMGAPTVAADIPACREVGLDAATYYAPGEDESLAERLVELLKSPERTRALASRSATRGTQFTWQRNARAVRDSLLKAVA